MRTTECKYWVCHPVSSCVTHMGKLLTLHATIPALTTNTAPMPNSVQANSATTCLNAGPIPTTTTFDPSARAVVMVFPSRLNSESERPLDASALADGLEGWPRLADDRTGPVDRDVAVVIKGRSR